MRTIGTAFVALSFLSPVFSDKSNLIVLLYGLGNALELLARREYMLKQLLIHLESQAKDMNEQSLELMVQDRTEAGIGE